MSDALDILRSYAQAVLRVTAAERVSLYLPAGSAEREVLVHEGRPPSLPELADAEAAAAFVAAKALTGILPTRLASASKAGVLYHVPLHWMPACGAPGQDRRRGGRHGSDPEAVWLGLRFAAAGQAHDDSLQDDAWHALLGLGASVAVHARTLWRGLLDRVTGLPERRDFQHELETALARAQARGQPMALLLLGPDDFGWVNERLDRRSGDRVLREIATRLRTAVRQHDHVSRYGGAVFGVVLRDTTLEDSRLVATNVARRLAEDAYHRRLLRLEFSAGVAVWPGAEPLDAHELVRRADQALSAARRGQAGNIRVWEKGSDVELARSLDRLQGIFTGEKSKDYRNMRLLLDTVTAVAGSTEQASLARSFTEQLSETLHARRAAVVQRTAAGTLELLAGLEHSATGVSTELELAAPDLELLERACRERDIAVAEAVPGARPLQCALPLLLEERCLGAVLLDVAEDEVSVEGSDRLFLEALASEMAVALDRARLTERERQREREEKERLQAEVDDLRRVVLGSRLAYASPEMEALLVAARKVARTDTTVLITGESGTGKEMLAHVLHGLSPRRERQLVVVDCGAISPTLIESELFGHEKGAFTGAHARNPGLLAQAHGSTVFLDEIGDLPIDLQSKLLRFVQEKQFTPVGGVTPRCVDARIVAATNVDLRARVAQGRFREDLFHRLNVVRLQVPPLRERHEDVLHLADVFLKQFAALYRRPAHRFTEAAQRALLEHAWPGNVRELQNAVMTSVLFSDGPDLDLADLQLEVLSTAPTGGESPVEAPVAAQAATSGLPEGAGAPRRGDQDPMLMLCRALACEIKEALRSARPVPLGKWLNEDLVLTADRLAGGVHRRASEMLGIPETTYRRQLHAVRTRQAAGLTIRTPAWSSIVPLLEDVVRSPLRGDVCARAESSLLAEIEAVVPGNVRLAAVLVGVTEPTVLRRIARLRQF